MCQTKYAVLTVFCTHLNNQGIQSGVCIYYFRYYRSLCLAFVAVYIYTARYTIEYLLCFCFRYHCTTVPIIKIHGLDLTWKNITQHVQNTWNIFKRLHRNQALLHRRDNRFCVCRIYEVCQLFVLKTLLTKTMCWLTSHLYLSIKDKKMLNVFIKPHFITGTSKQSIGM